MLIVHCSLLIVLCRQVLLLIELGLSKLKQSLCELTELCVKQTAPHIRSGLFSWYI
jgi:hypothetical protein